MAAYINSQSATDNYSDAGAISLGPFFDVDTATILVSGNPADLQFAIGVEGSWRWTDERDFTAPAGGGTTNSFKVSNIRGVRARNAAAGATAIVSISLFRTGTRYDSSDPIFEAGTLSPGALTTGGAVVPSVSSLTVFNVKDYGAVLDGSTDDTTKCQAAYNAAHAIGGGIVYFPNGTARTTADLVTYSNTWTLGAGWAATISRDANTAAVAVLRNANQTAGGGDSGILVSNLTLIRNGTATPANTPLDNVVQFIFVTNPQVWSCHVQGAAKGIHCNNCTNPTIHHNTIDGYVDNAIAFNADNATFLVGGGSMHDNYAGTPNAQAYTLGSSCYLCAQSSSRIYSNTGIDCGGHLVEVGSDVATNVSHVYAKNNIGIYTGLQVSAVNSILFHEADDCEMEGNILDHGSAVFDSTNPGVTYNNRCHGRNNICLNGGIAYNNVKIGTSTGDVTYAGGTFDVKSCSDFTVTSGWALYCTLSGFHCRAVGGAQAPARCSFVGCFAIGNGTANTAGETYGFLLDHGDTIKVVGCRAYDPAGAGGTQTHGLYANVTTNITDQQNDFSGNKTAPRATFTGAYSYAPLFDTGQVGAEIGYQEFTAPVNITATTELTSQVVVTAPTVIYDGNPVWVEFYCPYIQTPNLASSEALRLILWDNTAGVSLGVIGLYQNGASALVYEQPNVKRKLTPAVGSRIYSIRAYVSNAAGGNVGAGGGGAGAYVPGFIRITRA